ncbi:MAG: 50S ribosomal protein L32 [Candidatus Shapirobacteria bacterium]|nr:50S ribosomal protein L32 [Candidatus Shapirobacteria bacterium]MDD5074011.1 50S ribosomal protein L32 [Candidatus Shapirobacteria bacterium]MDD5481545.1 50S ribosomal protein L32 [Candidatus Shapirobacteria bacterium]
MTALPKRKISHYRQGKRRAAIKIKAPKTTACPNCQQEKMAHRVCPHCGHYKGVLVTKV